MNHFLEKINSYVWGTGLISLLLLTGLIYTLKLKFIQFKMFKYIFKSNHIHKTKSGSGLSQWKTVCMSLGTAMGTGNITGVAAAIAVGGAGAVFWMWVSAFLGMALVYAENSLSVIYSDDECRGPMAYLKKGLGCRLLAQFFAFLCLFAAFGMGGMVQVSSFADSFKSTYNINTSFLALIIFIIIFLVISGGAKRIGNTAQTLLPIAAILYAFFGISVLFVFREKIPQSLEAIFSQAFGIRQAAGGVSGYTVAKAVSVGIRRGIFSNEAGLGSSPILHSAAESDSPTLQGMWSMFEVFFDTIICCTLTALVILCASTDFSVQSAFSVVLGDKSGIFLTIEMAVFGFCTIIGWYYCGETAYRFITGKNSGKIFCLLFAAISSLGAIISLKTVWTLSDIFNGLMAFPNLLGLIFLINKVKRE